MAWGDVNGDGRFDVFVGGAAETAGELRLAIAKFKQETQVAENLNRQNKPMKYPG